MINIVSKVISVLFLCSLALSSFANEGTKTYKDTIPEFTVLLGQHEKGVIQIEGYQKTKNLEITGTNSDTKVSFVKSTTSLKLENKYFDVFSYYLNPNNNLKISIFYGFGKIYKVSITLPYKTSQEINENIDNDDKSLILKADLVSYLEDNQWKYLTPFFPNRLIMGKYEKENSLLEYYSDISSSLIVFISDKSLNKELQERSNDQYNKMRHDSIESTVVKITAKEEVLKQTYISNITGEKQ